METTTNSIPVIKVLVAIYPSVNALDILGPLEVLRQAQHNVNDPSTKAFNYVLTAASEEVDAIQGCTFKAQASFEAAQKRLDEFDVLLIPGGEYEAIIKAKAQPLQLIKAWSDLQMKNPYKERTLLSVGTGSFLLAQQGILSGLSATTHTEYVTKFEKLLSTVAQRDLAERADVIEDRYVVNNLRFDIGNEDENPYIRRKSDARRPSNARKGSNAWRESNTRRESNARRASMRLGGLRVITAGATSCGIDAALYLVSIMVSVESAEEVARTLQHNWVKGVVVDGIDV
jgi:transcriptional regulator GlxA family with amidase domain